MKYHFLNLHDVVIIVSILESAFLSAFFWLIPGKQRLARHILAFLFLLMAGALTSTLFIWNSYLQTLAIANCNIAPLVLATCLLLQGPALYLYLNALSRDTNLWQWPKALHLVPALTSAMVILAFNITVKDWLPRDWPTVPASTLLAVKYVWVLFKCVPATYIIACLHAEYRLRQDMKQIYSNISQRELMVADIVLGGFFVHWLWSCAGYLLSGYLSDQANEFVGASSDYIAAILLNTLFVFGLVNTRQLLKALPADKDAKPETELPMEKVAAIEQCIHVQKLYLENNINLERFAERAGLKPRDVSTIINSHYHSNFFEFINGFRIEEAKRLLMNADSGESILDIAYRSGFNSQSAFHRFFKRMVGITPSQYRNRKRHVIDDESMPHRA